MHRTILTIVALLSCVAAAHAQTPASSFTELQTRLKAGDTVSVTTGSGEVIGGDVARVSDTMLILHGPRTWRNRSTRTLAADEVQRIDRLTNSKTKGALIGLGLGFAIGAYWATSSPPCFESFSPCPVDGQLVVLAGGLLGAVGAGVGAGVGASIHAQRTVFLRTRGAAAQTAIAPLVSRNRAGLQLNIRW